MDNPVNISGKDLEDRVENYCVENNISYQRAKSGAFEIDFIIDTDFGKVYADCTNQNVEKWVENFGGKLDYFCLYIIDQFLCDHRDQLR